MRVLPDAGGEIIKKLIIKKKGKKKQKIIKKIGPMCVLHLVSSRLVSSRLVSRGSHDCRRHSLISSDSPESLDGVSGPATPSSSGARGPPKATLVPGQGPSSSFTKDDAAFQVSFCLQPGNHVARISVAVEDSNSISSWISAAWGGFSAVFPLVSTLLSYAFLLRSGDARATVTVRGIGG